MICWRRYSEEEEVTSFMVFYWIKQAFDTPVCEEDIFPNDDIESFIKVCQGRNRTGGIFGVVFSICSNSLIFRLQVLIFNCDWSWKIAGNWCTFYLDYQNQLNFKFLLWSFLVLLINQYSDSIFQLNATHHHMESTSLEVTCRIEQPGHFGNVMLVAETKPILTSFDSEVSLTDQFYVIKQVCHKTPRHHITLWTWTRYRNQIMKFYILKSISVLHTGYIFSTETE